jgi:integrase
MAVKRMHRKDGTVYYGISYRFPRNRDGEQRRETAGTLDDAKSMEAKIIKEVLAGRDPRVALGKTGSFEDHAKEVLAKHYQGKRCQAWAKIVIEKHLIPFFGKTPLANITVKRVLDYMEHRRAKGRARATVDNERAVLSLVLSRAVKWKLLAPDANPMADVPKLGEHNRRDRVLTPAEQIALIAAGDTNRLRHARDAAILSLSTGARHKEAVLVRWQDIDFERGLITFRAETTKNGKDRTVHANGAVLEMLKARHASRTGADRFCPFVFTYRGRPIKSVNGAFRSLCEAAKPKLGRDVVFHSLRHSWATAAGHAGCDPRDLMEWGGWSDLKMVERYYHTGAERSVRALDAIGAHLLATAPITTGSPRTAKAATP